MRKAGAPTEFKAYGYTFTLVKIERHIALYKQERDGRVYGYEVHKMRREGPLCNPQAKSKFGLYAWSYEYLRNAEKKYAELLEASK